MLRALGKSSDDVACVTEDNIGDASKATDCHIEAELGNRPPQIDADSPFNAESRVG